MMVINEVTLNSIVDRLVADLEPTRIYLYGSHAYGTPHAGSDVDLLVVVPQSDLPPHHRDAAAYGSLDGCGLPIELRVYTLEELGRRASVRTSLERRVVDGGKVLYDAEVGTGA